MTTVAIQAESLSKHFSLGEAFAGGSLREALSWTFRPRRWFRRRRQSRTARRAGTLWALQDVSFTVTQGEVIGIIGRNGAGKSTLLKLLSRVTEPTTGRALVRGRVGSLLEVGTGFHPDLTGRENIHLNGSILGMKRAEIARKFDAIVAFADIEQFLDTPVKHYSSGMYSRLAFSVAAHLEPEILLIDEVLAVGDVHFQKKCLQKISHVAQDVGRTVLLVSHNISAAEKICNKLLWLERGQVVDFAADVRALIQRYSAQENQRQEQTEWQNEASACADPRFTPRRLRLHDAAGRTAVMPIANHDEVWVEIQGDIVEQDRSLKLGYAIYSPDGQLLYRSFDKDGPPEQWPRLTPGSCILRSRLPARLLNEGVYRIELIALLHPHDWLIEPGPQAPAVYLSILGGLSDSPFWLVKRPGLLAPVLQWMSHVEPAARQAS